jgi:hypothetical protein
MADEECLPHLGVRRRSSRPGWLLVVIVLGMTMTFTTGLLRMAIAPQTAIWIVAAVATATVTLIRRTAIPIGDDWEAGGVPSASQ